MTTRSNVLRPIQAFFNERLTRFVRTFPLIFREVIRLMVLHIGLYSRACQEGDCLESAPSLLRSILDSGSSLTRLPVAAYMALQSAAMKGGTPGSPTPPGGALDSTRWTLVW